MANTYTWTVHNCDRVLATGVITQLHYFVNGEDGTYVVQEVGSVSLAAPDAEDMVEYEDVTHAQCVSWAQAAVGGADEVAAIEARLAQKLTEKPAPVYGTGTPW